VKYSLLGLAVLVIIIWIFARVVLAVTSVALHLLWVVAIIAAVIWLIGRVRNRT